MKIEKGMMKKQLGLSLPSAFDYIIVSLTSMVDIFAISRLGSSVVSAVGAMTSVIFFYNLIIKSIQIANNVIIARNIGKKEFDKMSVSTGNAVYLVILAQMVCISFLLLVGKWLPLLFKVDSVCLTYLNIRLIGSVPFAIAFILTGHERTNGKSNVMLYIRILSFFFNCIFDYLAIKLNYGIAGVAWATVAVETIHMILVFLTSRKTVCYTINGEAMKEVVSLAKHGVMDRIFDRGGKLLLDVILSRLGTFEYAAHVVIHQIEAFAGDFCYGFGIGITTTVGIELGKKEKKRLQCVKEMLDKLTRILMLIIPLLLFFICILLLPIILREKETLQIAYILLPFMLIYIAITPLKTEYSCIIEGMKELQFNAKLSLVVNSIKVAVAYILSIPFGIIGVWVTFPLSYLVIIIVSKRKINQSKIFIK